MSTSSGALSDSATQESRVALRRRPRPSSTTSSRLLSSLRRFVAEPSTSGRDAPADARRPDAKDDTWPEAGADSRPPTPPHF
eukprot:4404462-Lingulodinium_polyedra.AAC.1